MAHLLFEVESLECRRLLAGNVTAQIVNGDLQVTGDALDNDVAVGITTHPQGVPRLFVRGNDGTMVNGQADVFFALSNLADDVRITMNEGNDTVAFNTNFFSVPDDVVIRTNGGDDVVRVIGARVQGNLTIVTGRGSDTVMSVRGGFQTSTRVGENLDIRTGADADTIDLNYLNVAGSSRILSALGSDDVTVNEEVDLVGNVTIDLNSAAIGETGDQLRIKGNQDRRVTFGGDLSLLGNGRSQLVLMNDLNISGALNVRLGGALDQFGIDDADVGGPVNIQMGGGIDFVSVYDTKLMDAMTIDTGNSSDYVDLEDVYSDAPVSVMTSGGDDIVKIEEVELSGPLLVETGSGADQFQLNDSVTAELVVRLGGNRDQLSLVQMTEFTGPTTIDGGDGRDELLVASYQYPTIPFDLIEFVSIELTP